MALTAGTWTVVTQVQIQNAAIAAQGNASPNTLAFPSYGPTSNDQQSLTFGTSAGQCNILCAAQITLAATTAATYDLFTGTDLKDVYGGTAAIRTLRGIAVVIEAGGDETGVRIGGAAADATPLFFADDSDMALIFPSGPPFAQGNATGIVIDATHKNVKIENLSAVAVTFSIYLAGASS